jgi:hypothetical protein
MEFFIVKHSFLKRLSAENSPTIVYNATNFKASFCCSGKSLFASERLPFPGGDPQGIFTKG